MGVIRIFSTVAVLVIVTSAAAFGNGVTNQFLEKSLAQLSDKDRFDRAQVETLNKQGLEFANNNQYERVIEIAEKELNIAKQSDFPGTTEIVSVNLCTMAIFYFKKAQYSQAEPLFRSALKIYEDKLGPNNPAVAVMLNNLGNVQERQGHLAQAEPLYKRAIEINEKTLGKNHRNVAVILKNLAGIYRLTHRDEEAAKLEQRAAEIDAINAAELEKFK